MNIHIYSYTFTDTFTHTGTHTRKCLCFSLFQSYLKFHTIKHTPSLSLIPLVIIFNTPPRSVEGISFDDNTISSSLSLSLSRSLSRARSFSFAHACTYPHTHFLTLPLLSRCFSLSVSSICLSLPTSLPLFLLPSLSSSLFRSHSLQAYFPSCSAAIYFTPQGARKVCLHANLCVSVCTCACACACAYSTVPSTVSSDATAFASASASYTQTSSCSPSPFSPDAFSLLSSRSFHPSPVCSQFPNGKACIDENRRIFRKATSQICQQAPQIFEYNMPLSKVRTAPKGTVCSFLSPYNSSPPKRHLALSLTYTRQHI